MAINLQPADEKRPAFLSVHPPHWAARVLAWFLPIVFFTVLAAAILVKVPEVVTVPFALVPTDGVDPVRALRAGIVAELHANEGQVVERDELLFVIRSESVVDRTAELQALDTQVKGADASLVNAREKLKGELAVSEEEGRRLSIRGESIGRVVEQKKKELTISRQLADNYEKLHQEGLASLTMLTDRKLEVARVETQIEQLQTEQRELNNSLEKLRLAAEVKRTELREFERGLKEGSERMQIRQSALNQSLVQALTQGQAGRFAARAPCRGTILRLQIRSAGAQVTEGEMLCELACANEGLQAELQLPQSHVGRVLPGHSVKLFYDTFPAQRFGVRYSTLRWLSPSTANGVFRAFAEVSETPFIVDGQPHALRVGMSGHAQVVIGRRSLISYLQEPLRQLQENLSMPPPSPGPTAAPATKPKGDSHGN